MLLCTVSESWTVGDGEKRPDATDESSRLAEEIINVLRRAQEDRGFPENLKCSRVNTSILRAIEEKKYKG